MNNAASLLTKEQCAEAYDELMIRIGLSSLAEIEGAALLADNERLKAAPQFRTTQEDKKRIRRTVERELRRKSFKKVTRRIYNVTSHVAVVFMAAAILFSSTMVASAEFRNAVYKMVFTHEQRYTLIELDERTDLEFVDSEVYTWEHAYAPTVMPQGYTVSDVLGTTLTHSVIYTNASGGEIVFFQSDSKAQGTMQIDTENAQLVQNVLINDSEALLVNKNGRNTLVWRIGRSMLSLSSGEDNETLMAIAKGIKQKN
jgi:hypothetical protein